MLWLLLISLVLPIDGYNILLYSIRYGYSHMNYIGSIADTLQAAGHNVTVIQPEIDQNLKTSGCTLARVIFIPADANSLKMLQKRRDFEKGVNMWTTDAVDPSVVSSRAPSVADIYAAAMQNVLNQKEVMDELRAVHWDLGLFELLDYGGYPVLYEAGVKNIVGVVSVVLPDRVASILGLPQAWSYVPALQSPYSDDGSFASRLFNLAYAYYSWDYERVVESAGQRYMTRHHPTAPKIWEVVANMPVLFTNGEPLLDFPRPTLHKIVDLGGIILKEAKEVDDHWKAIFDQRATTVLISFGTLMKSSLMPKEYKKSIVKTIRRFPEVTFIWKYETPEDGTGHGVGNLHLSKWVPQTDLLASGKIKLFIGHGGAGGVIESATHGVPMITIPTFGDQYRNSRMIERFGNGIVFNKLDLASTEKLEKIIRHGLTDENLHAKAQLAKNILLYRPFSPQEKLLRHVNLAVKFGMFRAAQSVRSVSLSACRNKDLVQQAFVNKIKEYAQKGGDLANSDPAVKKALQDELNRLAMKFQLANSDVVAKLPTNFEKSTVESSITQLLEGKTLKQLVDSLTQEKSAYLASRNSKKGHETSPQ